VNRPARPTVNVDALGAMLDRALAHPLVGAIESVVPESVSTLRAARANLPAALGRLQELAAREAGRELDAALSGALKRLTGGKKGGNGS
jgi:hypothetical protein